VNLSAAGKRDHASNVHHLSWGLAAFRAFADDEPRQHRWSQAPGTMKRSGVEGVPNQLIVKVVHATGSRLGHQSDHDRRGTPEQVNRQA
jgi:hypothetical protein